MKRNTAVHLWNGLCHRSFGGEWGEDSNPESLGFVAMGAGLPPSLQPPEKARPTVLSVSFEIEKQAERTQVANWLREWANALDPFVMEASEDETTAGRA